MFVSINYRCGVLKRNLEPIWGIVPQPHEPEWALLFMRIKNLENEEWLPVVGYEEHYMVSNYSRVISIKFRRHVLMKPNKITEKDRYKKVAIMIDAERHKFGIHRLAAIAFIPNPLNLPEVNHIDGDRDNNHISNFEWTTHRENVNHGALTKGNTSKFVGVSFYKNINKWVARIYHNKKDISIGRYDTEELAASAYQKYCIDNNISLKYAA